MTRQFVKSLYYSVFAPRRLLVNQAEYALAARYGWVLIVVRWTCYSAIFVGWQLVVR